MSQLQKKLLRYFNKVGSGLEKGPVTLEELEALDFQDNKTIEISIIEKYFKYVGQKIELSEAIPSSLQNFTELVTFVAQNQQSSNNEVGDKVPSRSSSESPSPEQKTNPTNSISATPTPIPMTNQPQTTENEQNNNLEKNQQKSVENGDNEGEAKEKSKNSDQSNSEEVSTKTLDKENSVDDDEDDNVAPNEVTKSKKSKLAKQKRIIKKEQEKPLVPEKNYYLIDAKWMQVWYRYVGYDQDDANQDNDNDDSTTQNELPPPIDNKNLIKSKKLKPFLQEQEHFEILTDKAWHRLVRWYGGGTPEIIRSSIQIIGAKNTKVVVEIYPINVTVFHSSDLAESGAFTFSRITTLAKMKSEICQVRGWNPDKIEIWNQVSLQCYTDETLTLSEVAFATEQELLFKEIDPMFAANRNKSNENKENAYYI